MGIGVYILSYNNSICRSIDLYWNAMYTSICFETATSGSNNVNIEAEMLFLGDIDGDRAVNVVDITIVAKDFGKKLNP